MTGAMLWMEEFGEENEIRFMNSTPFGGCILAGIEFFGLGILAMARAKLISAYSLKRLILFSETDSFADERMHLLRQ
jgi:hypothetical protein